MTPDQAMQSIWDWGLVFIGACFVIGIGIEFIRDALKSK